MSADHGERDTVDRPRRVLVQVPSERRGRNGELRSREYLTEAEVERLLAADQNPSGIANTMSHGSSGGGWFITTSAGQSAVAVNSFKYDDDPNTMYGPDLTDLTVEVYERRIELIGEAQVIAAIGNEDAKFPFVGRGGLFYLLGDPSRLRRSWTGCVMRKVCHSTAPMRAD